MVHSLGLQKGLIDVVNAFAARRTTSGNHAVSAHVLLHMVGARDEYDPDTSAPLVADGLADPWWQPR
ncbi:MAG: hypothetical protein RLW62_12065 [Gammaproteobacteria bacterium]